VKVSQHSPESSAVLRVLQPAEDWGQLDRHPLRKLKPSKVAIAPSIGTCSIAISVGVDVLLFYSLYHFCDPYVDRRAAGSAGGSQVP